MLMDVLGIIIGFVAIVLVFSLLVTAIVQTIASLTRLRNHALRVGLRDSQLHATLSALTPAPPTVEPGAAVLQKIATDAAYRPMLDRRVTWLDASEIIDPLVTAGVNTQAVAVVQQKLDRTRRVMEDKYLQWARGITFAAGLIVAFWFGASAPELLQRLQTDQAFRARAEALADESESESESERAAMQRSVADLGALEIAPLTDWSFYFERGATGERTVRWDRLIGVFFMAVLLSFGAPFWYKALKEFVGLKDALRKKDEAKTRNETSESQDTAGATPGTASRAAAPTAPTSGR